MPFWLADERKTNELLRTEEVEEERGGGSRGGLADRDEAKENKCEQLREAEGRRVGETQARRRQTKFRVQAACRLAFWHGSNDESHQEANGRTNRGSRPVKLLYRLSLSLKPTNSTEPSASATASAPAQSKSAAARADNKALGLNFNQPMTGRRQRRNDGWSREVMRGGKMDGRRKGREVEMKRVSAAAR